MANSFYNEGLEYYLEGGAAFTTDALLKVALMKSAYSPAITDSDFASISTNQLGSSQTLGSKSSSAGAATGGNLTFSGIASSQTVGSIVLYHDAAAGTKTLISWWDTGTNLPLTTTGADIVIHWNGATPTGLMLTL